jgi:uncharacterized protein
MNRSRNEEQGIAMSDYTITPVPLTAVTIEDGFWHPRLETNRTVTIPTVLRRCQETGRIDNFRKAAGTMPGPYVGTMPFEDTDLYKAVEGVSYSLARTADPDLEATLDSLIAVIAAAQEPDGYLYTNRTIDPAAVLPTAGPRRWSSLVMSHELYNCGHLYEAACAHYIATGKRTLLDVALRSAALIRRTFGPQALHDIPGHQIIEMGLARLYRITLDRGLLEQAKFFLDQRGRHESRALYMYADNPFYAQDHLPVLQQRAAVGHAVRAVYMYCGMADVAALWPDSAYAGAVQEIWRDMVDSKIYLTGGIGARHQGEAFGEEFELPNATAYAETCATIGSVMWNHRLFLLSGESKYYDVLEQSLYNRLLSGVSLSGEEFFYANPLESDGAFAFNHGSAGRQRWFEVSCCPTNLSRFFPSLPGYIYATEGNALFVNLFVGGKADLEVGGERISLTQETSYPWQGNVHMTVHVDRPLAMRLLVRIPGWARETVLSGSLYRFAHPSRAVPSLSVNGEPATIVMRNGYAVLDRAWKDGDVVDLSLPMAPRKVLCDQRVVENRGKAALQRGPLVYCVEGRDAGVPVESLALGDESALVARWEPDFLGGVMTVRGTQFTAIPYFAWCNRGPGPMRVWLNDSSSR